MRLIWLGLVGVAALTLLATGTEAQCDCGDMEHQSPVDMFRTVGGKVVASPVTWGVMGLGLLGLGAWSWRVGWIPRAIGALALWSRFDAEELDDHPTRSRVLDLLRAHPGTPTRDLADLAGLNNGTLLYHLEILSRFGLVNSQRVGRERAWYLTKGARPDLRRVATLSVPTRRQLFDLIQATPGSTQAGLARTTGLSAATIHHHLQALAEADLVELRRDGARVLCFPVASPGQGFASSGATFRPATPVT